MWKSLRSFLRILCVVDDSHIYMQKDLLVRSARVPSAHYLGSIGEKPLNISPPVKSPRCET